MADVDDPLSHASLLAALAGTRRQVRVIVEDVNDLNVGHESLLAALDGTRRTVSAHTQEIARVDDKVEDYFLQNSRVDRETIDSMTTQRADIDRNRQDIDRIDKSVQDVVAPTVDQVVANPRLVAGLGEHFTTVGEFERWKKSSVAGRTNWVVGAVVATVAFVVLLVLALSFGDDLAIALRGTHYQDWVTTVLIAASLMFAVGIMFLVSAGGGGSKESVSERTTTKTSDTRPQPTPAVASTEVMPAVAPPVTTPPSPRVMV